MVGKMGGFGLFGVVFKERLNSEIFLSRLCGSELSPGKTSSRKIFLSLLCGGEFFLETFA